MIKYRIFFLGFGGSVHCPFNLGFMGEGREPAVYFDTPEEASDYIENNADKDREYVIFPVVSLYEY